MEDNFSQLLMEALVKVLIMPQRDSYNNVLESPVNNAVRLWAEANKDEIGKKVVDKISSDKIATVVADKVIQLLERFGGNYSSYDKEKYKVELDKMITEKLAERIAAKMNLDKV